MKSKIRIAYLAFFLVFILSLFSINVFADEEIADDPEPATDAPVVTRAAPATAAPKTKPSTQSTSKKKSSTYATQKIKYSSKKSTYATKSSNYVNNNKNTKNTQATTKNSSVSSTKANTSAVYNVNKEKVATDTLKKNDWDSIAEQLNKSDSDDTKTDVESFDYIKNNTAEGDNGIWILYAGIGLEIVAALIIITLIILGVKRRNRMKRQGFAAESPRNAPPAQAERASRQRNAQRAPQHSTSRRTQKRNVNKRSKFDTDDVYVNDKPRRSGRYKPRH